MMDKMTEQPNGLRWAWTKGLSVYPFTDSSGQTPDFNSYTFMRGSTYMFVNGGVSGSHPFMLGESYNNLGSAHVLEIH